ncbi:MAG: SDR family NAD(P)-dependent oxidoreductase [Acidimicrobiales bacterium]
MASGTDETRRLDGRVAIVTGAARGQGRAVVGRFVAAGAYVVAGDVLPEVDGLQEEFPGRVRSARLDVTDGAAWHDALQTALSQFGHVEILVNNAGVLRRMEIADETRDAFQRMHQVNCVGPFIGMQAVLPHMRAVGRGVIVNTLSTAAMTAFSGHAAYASSKWALRGLTKVAALEFAGMHIRVNSIVPGPILTPMVVREDDPTASERLARTPLGRAGLPSDIADLALFLVSDDAGFVTGAEFVVDGGQTTGIYTR